MPAWRDHTATMTSADNMILFGGFDGNDLISATTEIDLAVAAANDANAAFSPTTKAIASPVSARSGHSTVLWGKKVVMFGGEKGTTALAYGVGERARRGYGRSSGLCCGLEDSGGAPTVRGVERLEP